jgi:hypothetical protein
MIEFLKIYKTPYEKKRYGSSNDGGYVILDLNKNEYDILISCGISNDINFEKHFLSKNDEIKCFAFDGTINSLPENHDRINFIQKNIGPKNDENNTNFHYLLEQYKNIFLKMDIETYEFLWINSLSSEHLKNIKQIVIEFHFPFTNHNLSHLDNKTSVEDKIKSFKKLLETHFLVHLHGNNCCGTTLFENTIVPNVFECTFIRKDLLKNFIGYNDENIPSKLDRPNVSGNDEIYLNHYPFVI